LYSSPDVIRMIKSRRMRWTGHVERMRDKKNSCKFLVGEPEGKMTLGRHRLWCKDSNKMVVRDVVWCGMGWVILLKYRNHLRVLVNMVMNFRVP
jgi:hypothetical protein